MTDFPNQGSWHVQICHGTVITCGDARKGAISISMWITGFGTLRILGDLITPTCSLLNAR